MNKTDLKIIKYLRQGCSYERITKKLGRAVTDELLERTAKLASKK